MIARVTVEILGPVPVGGADGDGHRRPAGPVGGAAERVAVRRRPGGGAGAGVANRPVGHAARWPWTSTTPLAPPSSGRLMTPPGGLGRRVPGRHGVACAVAAPSANRARRCVWARQTVPLVADEEPSGLQRLFVGRGLGQRRLEPAGPAEVAVHQLGADACTCTGSRTASGSALDAATAIGADGVGVGVLGAARPERAGWAWGSGAAGSAAVGGQRRQERMSDASTARAPMARQAVHDSVGLLASGPSRGPPPSPGDASGATVGDSRPGVT